MGSGLSKILVIESDDSLKNVLCMMLMDEGYNVAGASDSRQGEKVMQQFNPDLMIVDILMPILMYGFKGLENIMMQRKQMPHLNLIVMSGGEVDTEQYLNTAFLMKAEKHLIKPFSKVDLMNAIFDIKKDNPGGDDLIRKKCN